MDVYAIHIYIYICYIPISIYTLSFLVSWTEDLPSSLGAGGNVVSEKITEVPEIFHDGDDVQIALEDLKDTVRCVSKPPIIDFSGMNTHLPAILMFTGGTGF